MDGINLSTLSPDPAEASLAALVLKTMRCGEKGQAAMLPRMYAVRSGCCRYVVTDHVCVGGESLVRLESMEGDCAEAPDGPFKTVLLQFVGGCLDGRTLRSDAADVHEAIITSSYYCLTDQGAKSSILRVLPCLCGQLQDGPCRATGFVEYRVVNREETDTLITVILEYLPPHG